MDSVDHLHKLEEHYRACACRSTTPFFSDRKKHDNLSHTEDEAGNFYRTYYQHDRDKILYSHSFRKLRLKTQIFPEHVADYLRTRLDHTLEVAQIARHFARQLRLNEDLVDAIALAHDIGHAPFAHSGERALHKYLRSKKCDGFKHNWQSLRVVDKLEKSYPDIDGLNLTRAVRVGILLHTGIFYKDEELKNQQCSCDMFEEIKKDFDTDSKANYIYEVQIVKLSDDFAQVIHDFEDALISKYISLEECVKHNIKDYPLLNICINKIKKKGLDVQKIDFKDKDKISLLLARIRSELIYQLTIDVTDTSTSELDKWEKKYLGSLDKDKQMEKFNRFVEQRLPFPILIKLNKKKNDFENFKDKISRSLIHSERISRMDGKADYVIRNLLDVYLNSPRQAQQSVLDQFTKEARAKGDIRRWGELKLKKLKNDKVYLRSVVDHIAGMTDRFALREFDQLYSAYPKVGL